MKHCHVAAGILCDAAGRVLITERLCDDALNGLWEFPGGKIGSAESPTEALHRELTEELGIDATAMRPFKNLNHNYPDRSVDLEFFLVTEWQSEPRGREGQRIRWVNVAELNDAELLPADKPVIEALQATATHS